MMILQIIGDYCSIRQNDRTMEKLGKIITYLIAVCFVLIVVIFLVAIYLMGYSTTHKDKQYIDSIITAIESYRIANHAPPETMSQLNFEQTVDGYYFKGIYFSYVNLQDGDYLVGIFNDSKDSIVNEYFSGNHRWESDPLNMKWFKLETNATELYHAAKIRDFEGEDVLFASDSVKMLFSLDGVKRNDKIQIIITPDCMLHPDSIAYMTVLYTNKKIRMEGWTAFDRYVYPGYSLGAEFGEWKYYDEEGNCYRKFWNYKENGKLIYETDR